MNIVIQMGRLTKDPEIRYTSGEKATCIARFSLAVDRGFKKGDSNEPTADFFQWTSFGKLGEFAEKYLKRGTKIVISGRIENNNYKNKDGEMVYSNQMIAEKIEFAESKKAQESNSGTNNVQESDFMQIPEGASSDLPFH